MRNENTQLRADWPQVRLLLSLCLMSWRYLSAQYYFYPPSLPPQRFFSPRLDHLHLTSCQFAHWALFPVWTYKWIHPCSWWKVKPSSVMTLVDNYFLLFLVANFLMIGLTGGIGKCNQLVITACDEGPGACSHLLTIISFLLIIATLPLSLLYTIKVLLMVERLTNFLNLDLIRLVEL